MLASTVLNIVSVALGDPAPGYTWPQVQVLLPLLNECQRAIVLARPDAYAITESIKLVAGTKQSLPTGAFRLLDVTRNMGTGATPGATINFSDRKSQDLYNTSWHTDTAVSTVSEVFYDAERDPLIFYVSEPLAASPDCYIEVACSKSPPEAATLSDSIALDDVYVPAMQEWILWRAFMVGNALGSVQKAQLHLNSFSALLGIKTQSDRAAKPEGDRP